MKGIKVNNLNNRAEIFLYDVIGDFWGEGISAKMFSQVLADIGEVDEINLRINSPGGDVFDGYAIYNQLLRNRANVVVDIDGLAASIASVIAMAGDDIRMADNALFMIHNPYSMAMGDAEELRKQADMLDLTKGNCIGCYQRNSEMKTEDISIAMDNETWYTAQEALDAGFVQEITGELQMAALHLPRASTQWIHKAPEEIVIDEQQLAVPVGKTPEDIVKLNIETENKLEVIVKKSQEAIDEIDQLHEEDSKPNNNEQRLRLAEAEL